MGVKASMRYMLKTAAINAVGSSEVLHPPIIIVDLLFVRTKPGVQIYVPPNEWGGGKQARAPKNWGS